MRHLTALAVLLAVSATVAAPSASAGAPPPLVRMATPPSLPIGSVAARLAAGPVLTGDQVAYIAPPLLGESVGMITTVPVAGGAPLPLAPAFIGAAWPPVRLAGHGDGALLWSDGSRLTVAPLLSGMAAFAEPTCPAMAAPAIDGERVAFLDLTCTTLVVRDLRTDVDLQRLPVARTDARIVLLAGDWVAWGSGAAYTRAHVHDLRTGQTVTPYLRESGVAADEIALQPDGTLAYSAVRGSYSGVPAGIVLQPPTDDPFRIGRPLGPAYGPGAGVGAGSAILGFDGSSVVFRPRPTARLVEEIDEIAPDGGVRMLLRARGGLFPGAASAPVASWGAVLLGADLDGGRLAWTMRSCDEVDVETATLAELPAGGLDLSAPEACPRPTLGRDLVTLDARGRARLVLDMPAAFSGLMTLTGIVPSAGRVLVRPRAVALPAGRHRVPLRLSAADQAWIARRGLFGRVLRLRLAGTAAGRPATTTATVKVVAQRALR